MTDHENTSAEQGAMVEQSCIEALRAGRHPDSPRIRGMQEAELDAEVVKLCKTLHLPTFHTRDSRRSDGAGFPDRVIVGRGGVLWRELKREWSALQPAQTVWRYQLVASGQDWDIWRPSDLLSGRIERQLQALTQPITAAELARRFAAGEADRTFAAAMAIAEPSAETSP